MAEKRKAPDAPDAARKRKAPTIDLTATDVTPPQAAPEPPPTPAAAAPPETPPPPPPPHEPPQPEPEAAQPSSVPKSEAGRSTPIAAMLLSGVAGGAVVAAVLGGIWYAGALRPQQPQPDTRAQQQIGELQQQLDALKNRPAPAPAVDPKSVDALARRVAQLETALKNLPKDGGADPQLAQKLADVQAALTPLTQRLASVESAIKAGDTAVVALGKRIDDIAVNTSQ